VNRSLDVYEACRFYFSVSVPTEIVKVLDCPRGGGEIKRAMVLILANTWN